MAKSAAAADKRKTSGDKMPSGSTDITMTGSEILLKTLEDEGVEVIFGYPCLLYTSPSPRDVEESRMPSSA